MSSCERCWDISGGNPDEYKKILKENSCTPQQQAGVGAEYCVNCHSNTVHIHTKCCVICGLSTTKVEDKDE